MKSWIISTFDFISSLPPAVTAISGDLKNRHTHASCLANYIVARSLFKLICWVLGNRRDSEGIYKEKDTPKPLKEQVFSESIRKTSGR